MYHAEVFETDRLVGEILAAVEEFGLSENTLVIIAADHGEEFKERSRIGHELTVYNELVHVPFTLRDPRRPGARRVPVAVSTLAIHDAILAVADEKFVPPQRPVVSRTFHYYKNPTKDLLDFRTDPNAYALIVGELKLIHIPGTDHLELYDLKADPGEMKNLWGVHPGGEALKRTLLEWIADNTATPQPLSREAIESYGEMQERLRALGYTR